MKKSLFLLTLSLSAKLLCHEPLVGKQAPNVQAVALVDGAIVQNFSLQDFQGQYVVLFFYPLDFTFVCPTELHAFQDRLQDFKERGVQIIGCSVDSAFSHLAWLHTPQSKGGIQGITYPLLSDLDKSISRNFQVLDESSGIAYRGLFLLDRKGIIRHMLINDLPLGRNVDEVLRLVDGLATYEQCGEVCPANWRSGDKTLKPTQEGLRDYFGTQDMFQ
jgi:peroxiredoxin 2/4